MHDCNPRLLPLDPNTKLTTPPPVELHTAILETVFPYMKVVGTLLHMVNCTRPDLAQAVGLLCRFNSAPGSTHVAAAKGVLRYLSGTKHLGVSYSATPTPLQGFCDSDYAGDRMAGSPPLAGSISRTVDPSPGNQSSKALLPSPPVRLSIMERDTLPRRHFGSGKCSRTLASLSLSCPSQLTTRHPSIFSNMELSAQPQNTLTSCTTHGMEYAYWYE
jgi:hypothetical protein